MNDNTSLVILAGIFAVAMGVASYIDGRSLPAAPEGAVIVQVQGQPWACVEVVE